MSPGRGFATASISCAAVWIPLAVVLVQAAPARLTGDQVMAVFRGFEAIRRDLLPMAGLVAVMSMATAAFLAGTLLGLVALASSRRWAAGAALHAGGWAFLLCLQQYTSEASTRRLVLLAGVGYGALVAGAVLLLRLTERPEGRRPAMTAAVVAALVVLALARRPLMVSIVRHEFPPGAGDRSPEEALIATKARRDAQLEQDRDARGGSTLTSTVWSGTVGGRAFKVEFHPGGRCSAWLGGGDPLPGTYLLTDGAIDMQFEGLGRLRGARNGDRMEGSRPPWVLTLSPGP